MLATPLIHPSSLQLAPLSPSQPSSVNQESVRCGDFRQAAFWAFGDLLHLLRVVSWKANYEKTSKFSRGQELPYCKSISLIR